MAWFQRRCDKHTKLVPVSDTWFLFTVHLEHNSGMYWKNAAWLYLSSTSVCFEPFVTRNLSKHFKAILRCFFFQRSRPMSLGLHGHQVSQVSPAPAPNENQASAIRASILVRHFRMCVLLRTLADFKPVMKRNCTILPIGPGGQSI